MRVVVAGLGVQGQKRRRGAGTDFVAAVDPVNSEAKYRAIEDVPLGSYDVVLACIPDEPKIAVLDYLLGNGKHVLVEKPLWAPEEESIAQLEATARKNGAVCYVAYNHRFEPHFVRMRDMIAAGTLGALYHCRMFYGNGTARLVRESEWRGTRVRAFCRIWAHTSSTPRNSGSAISGRMCASCRVAGSKIARRTMSCSPRTRPSRSSSWK